MNFGLWSQSRLGLIANEMGTRIGDMDSLAMSSATQHGWLPGNRKKGRELDF